MVRRFSKSDKKQTTTFKFNASLQLKKLKLEEYAHVIHAFQKGLTELNHCLRESLLENYISFHTFEQISQEFKLDNLHNFKIPDMPSIKTLFYSKAVELKTNEPEMISRIKQVESEKSTQEVIPGPPPLEPKSKTPTIPSPPPPAPTGSQTIPKITFPKSATKNILSSNQLGSSSPRRESDRASGIAILRKQMSEELKKIRTIIPDKSK